MVNHPARRAFAVRGSVALLGMLVCVGPLATSCSREPSRPRCSECGMFADTAPRFHAELPREGGRTREFDTPRCLFAYGAKHGRASLRGARVTEYYAQRLVPAEEVSFVVGSDVLGPMGRDLIPVTPSEAPRFVRDHGGRALAFEAIDGALLRTLDP